MKKQNDEFLPLRKAENNLIMGAPKGMKHCADLHVTKTTWGIVTSWKIESLWERIKMLFTGEVTIGFASHSMPPVSVHSGDWYAKQLKIIEKEKRDAEKKENL